MASTPRPVHCGDEISDAVGYQSQRESARAATSYWRIRGRANGTGSGPAYLFRQASAGFRL